VFLRGEKKWYIKLAIGLGVEAVKGLNMVFRTTGLS